MGAVGNNIFFYTLFSYTSTADGTYIHTHTHTQNMEHILYMAISHRQCVAYSHAKHWKFLVSRVYRIEEVQVLVPACSLYVCEPESTAKLWQCLWALHTFHI